MLLHFIFVVKEKDAALRMKEFDYVVRMAKFFQVWIRSKFSREFDVRSDIMTTSPTGIFRRLDTHTLVEDHRARDPNTYHFYLCHFRPFWTDCTCEGYHAENFGMIWWQQPPDYDELFLAEKNCTTVSHEIAHELLRQKGVKRFVPLVHDVWVRHFYDSLDFEQYGDDFCPTTGRPAFLTIDTGALGL